MQYIELTLHTTSQASELIADLLWQYTQEGVAILDNNDLLVLQQDKNLYWDYIEPQLLTSDAPVLIKCFLLPENASMQIKSIKEQLEKMQALNDGIFSFGSLEMYCKDIDSDSWHEIWKKHFKPLEIGKSIVICPDWVEYENKNNKYIILLDSSISFGTGEHETTAMCLEFLEKYLQVGQTVLDIGCGSGILGITSIKLGAKFAYLTDIDELAVQSAKANSKKNNTVDKVEVRCANLLQGNFEPVNLVVANLTADILLRLIDKVDSYILPNGFFIISGIIHEKIQVVQEAFIKIFDFVEMQTKGEWNAMVWKKRSA